jgi:hypothetical protein
MQGRKARRQEGRCAGEHPAGLGAGFERAAILSASSRHQPAPNGLFNGLIWPKAGCASIAYGATAASNFHPQPASPSFLARQESSSFAVRPLRGAPSIASGLSIAIEAAMVRAR